MKKKWMLVFALLFAAGMMCGVLEGCGGGGGSTTTTPAPIVTTQTLFPMTGKVATIPVATGTFDIVGATIVLLDSSGAVYATGTTNSVGEFIFPEVATGSYTLSISSAGADRDFTNLTQAVTLTATATLGTISVNPEYLISVQVVKENNSNEVFNNVDVHMECSNGYSQTVTTSGNGIAEFTNVPYSGTCQATVTNPNSTNGVGTDTPVTNFSADNDKTVAIQATDPFCWTETVALEHCLDPDLGNVTAVCDYSGAASAYVRCVEN